MYRFAIGYLDPHFSSYVHTPRLLYGYCSFIETWVRNKERVRG